MKCSVFIATSADGYIATENDDVSWLDNAGKANVDLGEQADMGFSDYIASVDCMVMGRNCLEKIAGFNLSAEQWPYKGLRVIVLSKTLKEPPASLPEKVEMHAGGIKALVSSLESAGYKHAYIDGGATITSFLNEQLINQITVTQAPVLLGAGKPLFGALGNSINLTNASAMAYPNDFVQFSYDIEYL